MISKRKDQSSSRAAPAGRETSSLKSNYRGGARKPQIASDSTRAGRGFLLNVSEICPIPCSRNPDCRAAVLKRSPNATKARNRPPTKELRPNPIAKLSTIRHGVDQ